MKLSDHAEEILEAMWIAIEEQQAAFYDPASMQLADDDAGCRELVAKSLVEVRRGMLYFRPEGREEGMKTIRRHRLAERLMMDVFNIKGKRVTTRPASLNTCCTKGWIPSCAPC